jgi:hypothetical protein
MVGYWKHQAFLRRTSCRLLAAVLGLLLQSPTQQHLLDLTKCTGCGSCGHEASLVDGRAARHLPPGLMCCFHIGQCDASIPVLNIRRPPLSLLCLHAAGRAGRQDQAAQQAKPLHLLPSQRGEGRTTAAATAPGVLSQLVAQWHSTAFKCIKQQVWFPPLPACFCCAAAGRHLPGGGFRALPLRLPPSGFRAQGGSGGWVACTAVLCLLFSGSPTMSCRMHALCPTPLLECVCIV